MEFQNDELDLLGGIFNSKEINIPLAMVDVAARTRAKIGEELNRRMASETAGDAEEPKE
jgi:hypothetical protein